MRKLWIGGRFVDGRGGAPIVIADPATEETVDEVARGGPLDVDEAVAAARAAFPSWRRTSPFERADLLAETARRLRAGRDELAVTLTRETGRTLRKNRGYVDWS